MRQHDGAPWPARRGHHGGDGPGLAARPFGAGCQLVEKREGGARQQGGHVLRPVRHGQRQLRRQSARGRQAEARRPDKGKQLHDIETGLDLGAGAGLAPPAVADDRHRGTKPQRGLTTVDAVDFAGSGNPDQPRSRRVEDRRAVQLGNGNPESVSGGYVAVGGRLLHRFDIASIRGRFQRALHIARTCRRPGRRLVLPAAGECQ